jgi:hypothetical protein
MIPQFTKDFWSKRISQHFFSGDSILVILINDPKLKSSNQLEAGNSYTTLSAIRESFLKVTCWTESDLKSPEKSEADDIVSYDALYIEFESNPDLSLQKLIEASLTHLKPGGRLWLKCSSDVWNDLLFPTGTDSYARNSISVAAAARASRFFEICGCWNLSYGPLGQVVGDWVDTDFAESAGYYIEVFAYKKPSPFARLRRTSADARLIMREALIFPRVDPRWFIERRRHQQFCSFFTADPADQVITNRSENLYPNLLLACAKLQIRINPKLLDTITEKICSGADSDRERLLRIYDFVQRSVFRDVVSQPSNLDGSLPTAEEILLTGVGRCGHVSRLMVALLQRAGIRAKTWQLPNHVTVKASIAGNQWFLLDGDAFKFGTRPMQSGEWIPVEALYESSEVLNRIPATGWFYDDFLAQHSRRLPRGYVEAVPMNKRGFVSEYFKEVSNKNRLIRPPSFLYSLNITRLNRTEWRISWNYPSSPHSEEVRFLVSLSSKSRGWNYANFRRKNIFPALGQGDRLQTITRAQEIVVSLSESSASTFVEVTPMNRAIDLDPETYFWPSEEFELKTRS